MKTRNLIAIAFIVLLLPSSLLVVLLPSATSPIANMNQKESAYITPQQEADFLYFAIYAFYEEDSAFFNITVASDLSQFPPGALTEVLEIFVYKQVGTEFELVVQEIVFYESMLTVMFIPEEGVRYRVLGIGAVLSGGVEYFDTDFAHIPLSTVVIQTATPDMLTIDAIFDCTGGANLFVNDVWFFFYNANGIEIVSQRQKIPYSDLIREGDVFTAHVEVPSPDPSTASVIVMTSVKTDVEGIVFILRRAGITFEISNPCDLLEDLDQMVMASPDTCWTKKNYKETMGNKIAECITLCQSKEYGECYDKLLHDIKPKLTGIKADEEGNIFGNGIFDNPWINCSELQQEFTSLTDNILVALKEAM